MRTLEDVLEEITPTPDPDFVADMEWRMRRGFPHAAEAPPARLAPPAPASIAAFAASALLAAPRRGLADRTGDGRRRAPVCEARGETAIGRRLAPGRRQTRTPISRRADPPAAAATSRPGPRSAASSARPQLTLASDPDEFDRIADAIFRIADRRDGFVLQSSFTQGEEGFSGGFVRAARARRPSSSRPSTSCRALATVRARSESGTDVTGLVRVDPRPAAHRAGAAHEPAAPARAGRHRHRRARDPAAARDRRQPDHPPARPAARRPPADRVRDGLRRARRRGRRRGHGRDRRGARRRGRVARGHPQLPDPGGRDPAAARARRRPSAGSSRTRARKRARERALA